MQSSRRRFLKIAGISAAGLSARPVLNAVAAGAPDSHANETQVKQNEKALKAKQWAMVVDTTKFHGPEDLEPLIEVCHKIHNVPHLETRNHEIKWIWETEYKHAFPSRPNQFLNARSWNTSSWVAYNTSSASGNIFSMKHWCVVPRCRPMRLPFNPALVICRSEPFLATNLAGVL